MKKEEIKKILDMEEGHIIYALGHLDTEYRGYADDSSICMMMGTIDELCKIPEVDVNELKYWRNYIENVMRTNDRNNAITVAVAKALYYIIKELYEYYE